MNPSWGFGYWSQNKEYKIVQIASYYHSGDSFSNHTYIKYLVEMLSYGKDSAWRTLDFSNFIMYSAKVVDWTIMGVIYWIVHGGKMGNF